MPAATLALGLDADTSKFHSAMGAAIGDVDRFEGGIAHADETGTGFFGRLVGGVQQFATALPGLGMMAEGVKGVGDAIFGLSTEANQATNDLQATFGMPLEDAQELAGVATEIFGDNFAGNLTEANAALMATRQNMRGLADNELKGATEKALALSDSFGIDVADSTNAANTLMDKFGITSDQAFDFITAGMQSGLDTSGDFLDTIGEYSTQFAAGGASAGQFFNLMSTGMQGGVLGTDKAADAFKEFRVRIQDGSTATSAALKSLGIDSTKLSKDMADGTTTAADAFNLVMQKLNETDDANLRMQAGVGLLGTQFEDLGTGAALNLQLGVDTLEDLAGATDSLNAKYNNFGSLWEGATRQMQIALMPLGDTLLNVGNQVMPIVVQAVSWLAGTIADLVAQAAPFLDMIGPALSDGMSALGEAMATVQPWLDGFIEFLQASTGGEILSLDQFIGDLPEPLRIAGQFVGELVANFSTFFDSISSGDSIVAAFFNLIGNNAVSFTDMMGTALGWVGSTGLPMLMDALGQWAQALVAWIEPQIPRILQVLGYFGTVVMDFITTEVPILLGKLGEWAAAFVGWVAPMIPPALAALGEMAGKVLAWVGEQLPIWASNLGQWAEAFWKWITTVGPPLIIKAQELSGQLLGWITGTALPALVAKLGEWAGAFVSWIGPKIGPMLGELGRFLGEAGTWLLTVGLPKLVGFLAGLAVKLVTWISDAIPGALEALGSFFGSLWDNITGTVQPKANQSFLDVAGSLIGGLLQGLLDGTGAVLTGIGDFVANLIGGFRDGLGVHSPSTIFIDIAKQLLAGLIVGIQQNAAMVMNTIHDLAMQIPEPIRNALGIHSPAEETSELGGNITAGLVQGVAAGMPALQAAMQALADLVIASGASLLTTMQATGEQMAATLGTWPGVLAPSFAALAAAWEAVFGFGPGSLAYQITGHSADSLLVGLTTVTDQLFALYTGQGGPWVRHLHELDTNFSNALQAIQSTVRSEGQAIGVALGEGIGAGIASIAGAIAADAAAMVHNAIAAAQNAAAGAGTSGGGGGSQAPTHAPIHGPVAGMAGGLAPVAPVAGGGIVQVFVRNPYGGWEELDADDIKVVSVEASYGTRARNPR